MCIFVDDVVVFTKGSVKDHIAHLQEVIRRFNAHGLRLNKTKCHFGYTRVLLLGHLISAGGREMDPSKAEKAVNWVEPTSGPQMQTFLGFINYLREYIPNCSELCGPLESVRNQKQRFTLSTVQRNAFETLVEVINNAPVLSIPDFELDFYVACDASQYGIGAVLYQLVNAKRRYIMFFSRSLTAGQKNYPATKRELLAIVKALRAFYYFLYGTTVKITYRDFNSRLV